MTALNATDTRVVVTSRGEVALDIDDVEQFEVRTEFHAIDCSTGVTTAGEWQGVRIEDLLEYVGVEETATHVVVTGADGYRVCVPILAALDALLAVSRVDDPDAESLPRFVGSGVESTRSVSNVQRIETVELAPSERPHDYEDLSTAID
jgi:DMSO/TMAO reductase YedYZ molybdopterin-dependent catalytic subunit